MSSTHLVSNPLAQGRACQYYGPCHPGPAKCWNVLAVFLHKMLSLLWGIVRIGCHFQPRRVENYRAMFGQCPPRILKNLGSKPEKVICYFCSISISLPEYWRRSPKQEFKTTVICVCVCVSNISPTSNMTDRSAYVGVKVSEQSFRQDPGKIPDWKGKKAQPTNKTSTISTWCRIFSRVSSWQMDVETQKGKNPTSKIDVARMTKKKCHPHVPMVHWHEPGNHHQNPGRINRSMYRCAQRHRHTSRRCGS